MVRGRVPLCCAGPWLAPGVTTLLPPTEMPADEPVGVPVVVEVPVVVQSATVNAGYAEKLRTIPSVALAGQGFAIATVDTAFTKPVAMVRVAARLARPPLEARMGRQP